MALATVVLVPFLTLALWRNIPSYVRYAAPAGALLVLLYGIGRDRVLAVLVVALVALTLANPWVALLPAGMAPTSMPSLYRRELAERRYPRTADG